MSYLATVQWPLRLTRRVLPFLLPEDPGEPPTNEAESLELYEDIWAATADVVRLSWASQRFGAQCRPWVGSFNEEVRVHKDAYEGYICGSYWDSHFDPD